LTKEKVVAAPSNVRQNYSHVNSKTDNILVNSIDRAHQAALVMPVLKVQTDVRKKASVKELIVKD